MTTQLQCPYCHTTVWVGASGQCPSCRKQTPPSLLQQAVQTANEAEGLAAAVSSPQVASITYSPAQQPQNTEDGNRTPLGVPAASSPVKSSPQKYALQFQRGNLAIGIVLLLMSGFSLFSSTSDPDQIRHPQGRRAAARAATLAAIFGGEANSKIALGLLFLTLGIYSLATSRKLVVLATEYAIDDARCDLCRQPAPDAAESFLLLKGGFRPFQGAFRCVCCDTCVRESNRIRFFYWLQIPAMILGFVAIPMAVLNTGIFIARLFIPLVELKPGAEKAYAILFIVAVILAALILFCHRQVSRRTTQLLGQRVDQFIRNKAAIRRWGWPRRVLFLRTIPINTSIVDIEHELQS